MLIEITVGVLGNIVYDFIKKGYEISKPVLQQYLTNQSDALTDNKKVEAINFIKDNNMEVEVIECIKADDIFSQDPTQEMFIEHIATSPIWQKLLAQLNNQNNRDINIHGETIAENSTVHTGTGDIVTGNSRKITTNQYVEQQTIVESQTIQATQSKKP